MSTMKILDISAYQPNVDYAKVKAGGIDGVILRCGITYYGKQVCATDECFEQHYAGFKAVGMPIGVYYFSAADCCEVARREAVYVTRLLKGKQLELPVYYDVECDQRMNYVSRKALTEICETFCDAMEAAGYFTGIYANTNYFRNKLDHARLAERYTLWLADYRGTNADKELRRDMWQYTSSGTVAGIHSKVDLSECYRDFAPIIKGTGLNGWNEAAADPEPVHDDFLPERGYFKLGDEHKNVGKIAAFMRKCFPSYTDKRALGNTYGPYLIASVTEFQRRTGLEPDGFFGPLTLAELEKYGFKK